jgi:F-type H+-transporting ATPase subunit delta
MKGASRASLAAATDRLMQAVSGSGQRADAGPVGADLFAVTGLLDRDVALRRALSDPSRDGGARAGLAGTLLRGKISDIALDQVTGLVEDRWSDADDLTDALEQLAVLAIADDADAQGQLDELEDELFRFSRVVNANTELRSALASRYLPAERKRDVVRALVDGKVSPSALTLMIQAVAHPRGRSVEGCLGAYASLAAAQRQRLLAEVRVAVPLTDDERGRLAAALAAGYGHDVHLNVVVDPQVIGGVSVRIGDELINGSVAGRLAELRRRLAS